MKKILIAFVIALSIVMVSLYSYSVYLNDRTDRQLVEIDRFIRAHGG